MAVTLAPNTPQYFFDDTLIAHQQRLVRQWLPATVYPEPIIVPDKPWEGRMLVLFGTVLELHDGYRLYYCDFTPTVRPPRMLVAMSADGVRWQKPELGALQGSGNDRNNIVLTADKTFDSPSIIFDPDDAATPYKLLVFQHGDGDKGWSDSWGMYAYTSANGLDWQTTNRPVLKAGDRSNLMPTKEDGKYVLYTRHPRMMQELGTRAIYRSESDDFADWTEPELVLAPDLLDAPDVEYYGMSVFKRHGWYFGLLEYWKGDIDTIETHLVISRDGKSWMRSPLRQPFIAPAYDWNRTWNSCASNGPIILNEQMVFYFGGRWTSHHYDSAQQLGVIGYASLGLDRFCALEGTWAGQLVTQPIQWPGGDLVLNADTRQSYESHPGHTNGQIAVEVLDAEGAPLPEWSGEQQALLAGNTHSRARFGDGRVMWPQDKSLDALRGQNIRLRFHLSHARLFTIEARVAGE